MKKIRTLGKVIPKVATAASLYRTQSQILRTGLLLSVQLNSNHYINKKHSQISLKKGEKRTKSTLLKSLYRKNKHQKIIIPINKASTSLCSLPVPNPLI